MKLASVMICVRLVPCVLIFFLAANAISAVPPNTKPTIVIVPAAWHSPIHYVEYIRQLHLAGFATVSQRLPSCDTPNPAAQSVGGDAAFIRQNQLLPLINSGKEVVLIVHSYSGGPGSVAAKGLSTMERHAAGLPGGIIGMIFISAFIAKEGVSLLSASGGQFSPWVIEYNDGQLGVQNAKDVFYNDVPGFLAGPAVAELRNQSRHSAETPCGPPAWSDAVYDGRRAFVSCSLDHAIPPVAQQTMLQQSGVQWDVVTFATGHAPFLSQPKQLGAWTTAEIGKFEAVGEVPTK